MLNQKKHTALALILVVMLIVGLAPIRAQDVVELNWRTRPGDEAEQATYQAVNDRINESFDNI